MGAWRRTIPSVPRCSAARSRSHAAVRASSRACCASSRTCRALLMSARLGPGIKKREGLRVGTVRIALAFLGVAQEVVDGWAVGPEGAAQALGMAQDDAGEPAYRRTLGR